MVAPKKLARAEFDPSKPLANARNEAVALLVAVGKDGYPITQADAYKDVYPRSRKWLPSTVYEKASRMCATYKVRARIEWLKARKAERTLLTTERKLKILSRIAMEVGEHDPADYVEAGADGAYITFGRESRNRLAVAGIKSRTEMSGEGDGKGAAVVTDLKLRPLSDAIEAIKEHNKMTGAYPSEKPQSPLVQLIANGIIIETNIRREPRK